MKPRILVSLILVLTLASAIFAQQSQEQRELVEFRVSSFEFRVAGFEFLT